jgi:hypothetical protein
MCSFNDRVAVLDRLKQITLFNSVVILLFPAVIIAQTSSSVTQTLSAQIDPIGKLSVPATLNLASSGTIFGSFSGTLVLSNRVRTTSAGAATITVQGTTDFSPAAGPSIASGALTYSCSGASLGTACSGTQTVSLSAQTPVLSVGGGVCTGGGGTCSSTDPNSVSVNLVLADNPVFHTGTYSAQVTFVISAT